jgi:hypothetical protein
MTLQDKVEAAIRETLKDPCGAGSDMRVETRGYGVWLAVEGNLDVQHLASHIIQVIEDACTGE